MKKRVLIVATVQSHICQFHKPLAQVLYAHGWEVHVAARDNLAEKNGLKLDFAAQVFDVPFDRSPFSAAAQLRTLLLALLRACRKGVFIVASEIIQSNFIDLDTALGQ